jgi:hypothetical protein
MLSLSTIDPFSTKEARAYMEQPVIAAMRKLYDAYTKNKAKQFQEILSDPRTNLLSDPFLAEYVDDLLQEVRKQILRDFVRPYKNVKLKSIAHELNVSTNDVEPILVKCILDGSLINAKIDQGKGILVLSNNVNDTLSAQWNALSNWADAIVSLND